MGMWTMLAAWMLCLRSGRLCSSPTMSWTTPSSQVSPLTACTSVLHMFLSAPSLETDLGMWLAGPIDPKCAAADLHLRNLCCAGA